MENDLLYEELKNNFFIIAGPCVIENEKMVLSIAEKLKVISEERKIKYIFKASFDKANRTSVESFRGLGLEKGLRILEKVKNNLQLPITTDIHESYQAKIVSEVVDILQIPAFLCRQTDLLLSAAKTQKIINVKKAQFIDGKKMIYPINKILSESNNKIILTERGSFFGFDDLVVDFRQVIDMKEFKYPVVLDVTHSTQKPSALHGKSGGTTKYAESLAMIAKSIGIDGLFFEVHENPEEALSDGPNMITPDKLNSILCRLNVSAQFSTL